MPVRVITVPTLSEEHLDAVVFAHSFLCCFPAAIPEEYIGTSSDGEFNESKVLSPGCFVEKGIAGLAIEVAKVDELDTRRFQKLDEGGRRLFVEWEADIGVQEGPIVGVQVRARIYK